MMACIACHTQAGNGRFRTYFFNRRHATQGMRRDDLPERIELLLRSQQFCAALCSQRHSHVTYRTQPDVNSATDSRIVALPYPGTGRREVQIYLQLAAGTLFAKVHNASGNRSSASRPYRQILSTRFTDAQASTFQTTINLPP